MLASDIVLSYENDKFINLLGSKNGKKSPSGFKTIISTVFATSDLTRAELLLESNSKYSLKDKASPTEMYA